MAHFLPCVDCMSKMVSANTAPRDDQQDPLQIRKQPTIPSRVVGYPPSVTSYRSLRQSKQADHAGYVKNVTLCFYRAIRQHTNLPDLFCWRAFRSSIHFWLLATGVACLRCRLLISGVSTTRLSLMHRPLFRRCHCVPIRH